MKITVKSFTAIALSSLIAISITACNKDTKSDAEIAVIEDKRITQVEIDAYLQFKRIPVSDENKKRALVDQYLEREALVAAIKKSALLDEKLLKAEINEFKKEMYISRYFERFLKETVTEESVKNYYVNNAEKYQHTKIHVAHILFRTQKNMSEVERQVKYTLAQEAKSKLATGEEFFNIANNYSEDKISGKKGGDLGWLGEGAIDPKFSQVAFDLAKGSVSDIFETPFGYHIIKVLDEPKTVKKPLEEVSGDIRYQLRNKAKSSEISGLMKDVSIER